VHAPNAVARFLREAEVMVRVRHPNVVELVSWGTVDDGRPYLAMEFLTGTDLARVLAEHGRLPLPRVLAILEPTCAALAAAHAQAIVHRDLKASNVFLARAADGSERVVLIDFGIAKLAAPDAAELTTSRQLVGTPVTMAPEQIAGGAVDARTDVYGLGVMTFHLLTGGCRSRTSRRPSCSTSTPTPAGPSCRRSRRCRPRSTRCIARAMAIEPAQRYADAARVRGRAARRGRRPTTAPWR
jgi:serine/threonine protein kinase